MKRLLDIFHALFLLFIQLFHDYNSWKITESWQEKQENKVEQATKIPEIATSKLAYISELTEEQV